MVLVQQDELNSFPHLFSTCKSRLLYSPKWVLSSNKITITPYSLFWWFDNSLHMNKYLPQVQMSLLRLRRASGRQPAASTLYCKSGFPSGSEILTCSPSIICVSPILKHSSGQYRSFLLVDSRVIWIKICQSTKCLRLQKIQINLFVPIWLRAVALYLYWHERLTWIFYLQNNDPILQSAQWIFRTGQFSSNEWLKTICYFKREIWRNSLYFWFSPEHYCKLKKFLDPLCMSALVSLVLAILGIVWSRDNLLI